MVGSFLALCLSVPNWNARIKRNCEFLRKSVAILQSSSPVQAAHGLGRSLKQGQGPYLIMMRVNSVL